MRVVQAVLAAGVGCEGDEAYAERVLATLEQVVEQVEPRITWVQPHELTEPDEWVLTRIAQPEKRYKEAAQRILAHRRGLGEVAAAREAARARHDTAAETPAPKPHPTRAPDLGATHATPAPNGDEDAAAERQGADAGADRGVEGWLSRVRSLVLQPPSHTLNDELDSDFASNMATAITAIGGAGAIFLAQLTLHNEASTIESLCREVDLEYAPRECTGGDMKWCGAVEQVVRHALGLGLV